MNSTSDYFQACSYTTIAQAARPYTLAVWINPNAPVGTILHLSSDRSGVSNGCMAMLGFSSNGSIVAQSPSRMVMSVVGPQIPINNWTHIAQTWSSANGLRLCVNGDLYGWTPMPIFAFSGADSMCIFLGTSGFGSVCSTAEIIPGSYAGAVDEFYVYNRELTLAEICPLAHPWMNSYESPHRSLFLHFVSPSIDKSSIFF